MKRGDFAKVLEILDSDEVSLKRLAEMTGLDVFLFYQGAELRNLELSGQDLTGMNFDKADLRFSSLEGAKFDEGAFNGSLLDQDQLWAVDEYEFYAQDLFDHRIDEILVFCRLRPLMIINAIAETGDTLNALGKGASISTNALRKVRNGQVVSHGTAVKLLRFFADTYDGFSHKMPLPFIQTLLRQPVVQFLSGGINMPFKHVSRDRLRELVSMRAEIVKIRTRLIGRPEAEQWRDTAEAIESMLQYYRRSAAELDVDLDG